MNSNPYRVELNEHIDSNAWMHVGSRSFNATVGFSVVSFIELFACWVILHVFVVVCCLLNFILSGIPSGCQTVWIKIKPKGFVWSDLGPNWSKGYQQMTLACKGLIIYRFQQIIERNITYGEVIKE